MQNQSNKLFHQRRGQIKNCLPYWLSFFLLMITMASGCKESEPINASDVILFVNSNTHAEVTKTKVIPYLNHFGVKYKTIDIAKESLPTNTENPALVIIGHPEIANGDIARKLEQYLKKCQSKETGILSFDPCMPTGLLSKSGEELKKDTDVGALRFANEIHYITGYQKPGDTKDLFGYMAIPVMTVKEGRSIITGNNHPLLVVSDQQKGRVAQWTSQDWMYYSILGPLGGLDDCLWKSIVWAARKPFVMQAMPPIVTMRVDDVMGAGRQQWNVSPFQWVKTANKYGFKPWMGLFIYNISPEGIEELKELIPKGLATGTPHAFGRPPRKESYKEHIVKTYNPYYKNQLADSYFVPDYWYSKAIPYLSKYYDEFIFFDHNNQKPWSPDISKKIIQAVDDWYTETGVVMGEYLIPHWNEISANMMAPIQDHWKIDMVSAKEVDISWGEIANAYNFNKDMKPVRTAPFKLHDEPVVGRPKKGAMDARSSYSAGFLELGGRQFFEFSYEINDLIGYDWRPDNDVQATADRGIQTISRGLEGKFLSVLFTHETDYIYSVKPENWEAIFKKMNEGIAGYQPIFMTMDDGIKVQRAFYTSEIQSSQYDLKTGELQVKLSGKTDVPTGVYVYTDSHGSVEEKFVEIPIFQNETVQTVKLTK